MKYFGIPRPVLEVGSGHRPYPQSDVLVDKFLNESQRGGKLRTDGRPLIVSDIEKLPFRDRAFGFSIAAHVLEHVKHPPKALAELMRVSQQGYLETPSALLEFAEPHRDYHLWFVKNENGELVFLPKKNKNLFHHDVLRLLLEKNWGFKLFYHSNPQLTKTRFYWNGEIPYRIEKRPFHPNEYAALIPQSIVKFFWNLLQKLGEEVLKIYFQWRLPHRPKISLAELIQCPQCRGTLEIQTNRIVCATCKGYYPRKGDLYFLSPDYFVHS